MGKVEIKNTPEKEAERPVFPIKQNEDTNFARYSNNLFDSSLDFETARDYPFSQYSLFLASSNPRVTR